MTVDYARRNWKRWWGCQDIRHRLACPHVSHNVETMCAASMIYTFLVSMWYSIVVQYEADVKSTDKPEVLNLLPRHWHDELGRLVQEAHRLSVYTVHSTLPLEVLADHAIGTAQQFVPLGLEIRMVVEVQLSHERIDPPSDQVAYDLLSAFLDTSYNAGLANLPTPRLMYETTR